MSKVPTSGSISLGEVFAEYFNGRGSVYNGTRSVSLLQQRVNPDGNAETYAGGTTAAQFKFSNIRGKSRRYGIFSYMGPFLPGTEPPPSLRGPSTATSSTPSGFTDILTSYTDDSFVAVNLPFPFRLQGVDYYTAYVGSNGYITFGEGYSSYSSLLPSFPSVPKIFFGPGDRNMTYVGVQYHSGYGSRANTNLKGNTAVVIRIETNSVYNVNLTRGTADSVIEITFVNPENTVGSFGTGSGRNESRISISTGNWVNNPSNTLYMWGIYSASAELATWGGNNFSKSNSQWFVTGGTNGDFTSSSVYPAAAMNPYPIGSE